MAEFLKENNAEEKPLINLDRVRMTKKTKYVNTETEYAPLTVLVEHISMTLKHK